jgi:uncharacterized protein
MRLADTPIKKRYKVNLPLHLMECEVNYWRLLRLLSSNVSDLAVDDKRSYLVGSVPLSESSLQITVMEQTKYTTVVHIEQYCRLQNHATSIKNTLSESYSVADHYVGEPTCANERHVRPQSTLNNGIIYQGDVRLYHDANLAEVVKCQRYRQFAPRYEYPNIDMHQIDEKAQMNRFLGELLAHCLAHGRVAEVIFLQ